MKRQEKNARKFRELHNRKSLFLLPNVWDAGSAYIFEKEGYEAIATTSAGISYALGYPDGQHIGKDDLLYCIRRIQKRISVPLSVDMERGYGESISDVVKNVRDIIEEGVVGINIEDGRADGTLDESDRFCDKIRAIVKLREEMGVDFIINARTCTYWLQVADEEQMLTIALERGKAFADAGADCIFIPGKICFDTAEKLVSGINTPVNLILTSQIDDYKRLNEIGVRRLSVGSGPVRLMIDRTINLARKMISGDNSEMLNNLFSYDCANKFYNTSGLETGGYEDI